MRLFCNHGHVFVAITTVCLSVVLVSSKPVYAQNGFVKHDVTPKSKRVLFERQPLPKIPPGTRFKEKPPAGWSNLISFVRGKLSSGDVDAVSETVKYYAETFNLVMLANTDTNADGKYELDQVAVGFSMLIDGKNTVVTSDTQEDLGGDLSIIGRTVLDGNVESLSKVEQVARTKNSLVIDAPAILLRNGQHTEMVVRYYIWVFPENGNIGTLVWLLQSSKDQSQLSVADTTIQLLPPNMQENRVMNVDADKFNLFGIPSKDAFALVQIPQGVAFEMNEEMQAVAALKNYTPETFAKLTSAVASTLKTGRKE
ncbi:pyruvate kinase [Aporhodopirellula aestuarii]|uniref:Pyruvate kinase n=1 Tax=Aporhodopirellula aestuarii TaxID=2950107 RepID=A0ABT0UBP8_9BACT|nr:pyruvate kinase [Aporhodopirellula aestuarii]MCM2374211.1 pyruvate kinase [Aporhodopirellula aestuarii]